MTLVPKAYLEVNRLVVTLMNQTELSALKQTKADSLDSQSQYSEDQHGFDGLPTRLKFAQLGRL
jgi:hypothetical protein